MKRNGRPALIERPDIKNTAHLDLLDAVERTLVSYRWGIATGQPLTQAETAEAMSTTRDTVRRVEAGAAHKIIEHLQSTTRTSDIDTKVIARIERLEHIVAALQSDLADLTESVNENVTTTVMHEMTWAAARRKRRWVRKLP
jgi:hypothetical protein